MAKNSTPPDDARLEFSAATRELLAKNASYRCIVPRCAMPTIGPGDGGKPASIGTAAHIHSAALKGPRGRGGLSDDQIRDASNGVWCCANHGRLIDTNQGERYPVTLLHGWRALLEARLRREMDGNESPIGWIERVVVQKSFLYASDATIEFSKVTVLQGPAAGKTAIAEWLIAMAGDAAPRWTHGDLKILATLEYSSPLPHAIELDIDKRSLTLTNDGVRSPVARNDFNIVLVRENCLQLAYDERSDDDAIAKVFASNAMTVRNLVSDIERNGTDWGRALAFGEEDVEDDDGQSTGEKVMTLRRGSAACTRGISFGGLSTSEKLRVMIEFGAALARTKSRHAPTMLVVDASSWGIDESRLAKYAGYFLKQPFQTLLIRGTDWQPPDAAAWEDWRRYRLQRKKYGDRATLAEAPW